MESKVNVQHAGVEWKPGYGLMLQPPDPGIPHHSIYPHIVQLLPFFDVPHF